MAYCSDYIYCWGSFLGNCSFIALPSPVLGLVPPAMTSRDGGNANGLLGTILALQSSPEPMKLAFALARTQIHPTYKFPTLLYKCLYTTHTVTHTTPAQGSTNQA